MGHVCVCVGGWVTTAGTGALSISALSGVDLRQSAQEIRQDQVRSQRPAARGQYISDSAVTLSSL